MTLYASPSGASCPIEEPAGLATWRLKLQASTEAESISEEQALRVLSSARDLWSLSAVAEFAGVSETDAVTVVARVGAQYAKRAPARGRKVSFARGRAAGLGPGVHELSGEVVTVMAQGWAQDRGQRRNVAASYVALLAGDETRDLELTRRWMAKVAGSGEVTYHVLAHLRSVSLGTFRTLEGVSDVRSVMASYVRGFDMAAELMVRSRAALRSVFVEGAPEAEVEQGLREAAWLLGVHGDATLARMSGGWPAAEAVEALRDEVLARPRVYVPGSLAELSASQFAALCSRLGCEMPTDEVAVADLDEAIARVRASLVESRELVAV